MAGDEEKNDINNGAPAADENGGSQPAPANDTQAKAAGVVPPGAVPQVPPPPGGADYALRAAADKRRRAFGRRLGRTLRSIFIWLLVILAGVIVGVGVWLMTPTMYQGLLQPLVENAANISQVESDLEDAEERLDDLEAAQLDAEAALLLRMGIVEDQMTAADRRLDGAEDELARIDDLEALLNETAAQLAEIDAALTALEEELPGVDEYVEYNRQLSLIRAWHGLLRARIQLEQNNGGLAQEEITDALDSLDAVYAISSEEQQAALNLVIDRLELAQVSIDDSPFTALSDLDVAWRLLSDLIGPQDIPAEETPEPEATAEPVDDGTEESAEGEGEEPTETPPADDGTPEPTSTPTPSP